MCSQPMTDCLTCLAVDFFRRSGRPVTQSEDGSWWDGPHRLGGCLDEIRDEEINNETKENAA